MERRERGTRRKYKKNGRRARKHGMLGKRNEQWQNAWDRRKYQTACGTSKHKAQDKEHKEKLVVARNYKGRPTSIEVVSMFTFHDLSQSSQLSSLTHVWVLVLLFGQSGDSTIIVGLQILALVKSCGRREIANTQWQKKLIIITFPPQRQVSCNTSTNTRCCCLDGVSHSQVAF